MAQTENTYTQTDTTTVLRSFTFPYINQSDIKVTLDGVATTAYSHPNLTQIQLNSAPAVGTVIRIYRQTSDEETQATFYSGSAIRARDLNNNFTQNLYVTQETNNNVASAWKTGDPTIISTETWAGNDTKVATTGAIDGRIDSKIDTALTTDIVGGDRITVTDNSPGSGQVTIKVTPDSIVNADVNSSAAIAQSKLNIADATTSASGYMSGADKTKLNGIETAATADQTAAEIRTLVESASDSNVFTDADHTKLNAIEASATADQTDAEIRAAVEAAGDSNVFTDADHTKLNGIETAATADQTAAEIKTAYESNAQTNALTDDEKEVIDGVTANTSEINKLQGFTGSTANLNIVAGKSFRASTDGALSTTSDTEMPSSKVVANHVAAQIGTVGGFTTITNDASFPATASQPATGVIISISDAQGIVVSGTTSTTGRTVDGTPATVTINNFPSSLTGETLASGVGLLVTSTGSGNIYNYHKLLAAESDVKQLSDDINDFNARYRVAGSAPGSNNDDGDLWFDATSKKMKVYNGTTSQFDDVASVGSFYVNTISSSSSTGGGSATFNGSAYRFTLSNAGTSAQQHIVSVNGVIQKPNSGTSQPSEGFALSGNDIIFSAAPASGSDFFIITCGSSVSIGTPSANSVNSSHIIDGSIVNGDISNSANIVGSKVADDSIPEVKLDIHNAPATNKYLKYTSNGMEWSDGASEGTDVKSTGESGTTKFLRVDGDGTSSWQVPPSYTHPNHTGEVTSTADGAQVIASNVVDEDNLKVSNSPTDGQVLSAQSGNTGGLTWTSISAAPQVELVADGAIAANHSVIVTSAGKAKEIAEVINTNNPPTALTPADLGSDTLENHGGVRVGYDSVRDLVFVMWVDGASDLNCSSYAWSNASSTLPSEEDTTEINDNYVESWPQIASHPTNGYHVCAWKTGSNNRGRARMFNFSSSGQPSQGSDQQVSNGTVSSPYENTQQLVYDPDDDKFIVGFRGGGNEAMVHVLTPDYTNKTLSRGAEVNPFSDYAETLQLFYDEYSNKVIAAIWNGSTKYLEAKVGTVSGTSTSWGSTVNIAGDGTTSNNGSWMAVGGDPTTGKLLFTWMVNDGGSNLYGKCKVASVNGNSFDLGSETTFQGTTAGGTNRNRVNYDPTIGKFVISYRISTTTTQVLTVTISGTTPSFTSPVTITGSSNTSHSMVYNPDLERWCFVFRDSSGNRSNTTIDIGGASNNLSTSFIGFSDAAYSDGQTAKINVVGNTTTQSSLTAGTRYYVNKQGNLQTTADTPSVEAGLALSSTKLLIKG